MKKLFLSGALALSLLLPSYTATAVTKQALQPKVQQVNIIKDGMYDNHNSYVDESQYSLEQILESVELIGHDIAYSISYEDLDGQVYSTVETVSTSGTGIVIEKKDGKAYILTNNHVTKDNMPLNLQVPPCKWFKIEKTSDRLYIIKDGGIFQFFIKAKKVASDSNLDTALLEVEDSSTLKKFPYKIGNSDDLRAGDFIWIVGNPMGIIDYALKGNVSKTDSNFSPDWFMIGCNVQPGYSGGAVVAIRDGEYELVGIVVATIVRPQDQDGFPDALAGYGIAIKINPAMEMVNEYFNSLKKKDSTATATDQAKEQITIEEKIGNN